MYYTSERIPILEESAESAPAALRDSSLKPTTLLHVKLIKKRSLVCFCQFILPYSSLLIVNSIYFSSTFSFKRVLSVITISNADSIF